MHKIRNGDNVIIAWWFDDKSCENKACLAAIAAGRPVHIIPAHTDPRAEAVHLVLPDFHFATVDEATAALEVAWADAETVFTFADRNAAYARNVPVKISHEIK